MVRITFGIVATFASLLAVAHGEACSSSEMTQTDTITTDYSAALASYCATICASECIATMNAMADELPDCEYSTGINYHETTVESVAACEGSTTGDFGLGTSSGATCSASESDSVLTYFTQYADAIATSCGTDWSCTSDCMDILVELGGLLPNCVGSDGINYYETFEIALNSCSTGAVGSPTTSTTTGTACSATEDSDTTSYFNSVYTEYTTECSTNTCASGCIDILNFLLSELPDCVAGDGNNYYESVSVMLSSCGSATTTTTTGSSGSSSTPSFMRTESPAPSSTGSSSKANDASKLGSASLTFAGAMIAAAATHLLL